MERGNRYVLQGGWRSCWRFWACLSRLRLPIRFCSGGGVSAEDLAVHLAMPEADTRAVIAELVQHRLVRESREASGKLRAVRPDIGLEALLRRREADLLQWLEQLDGVKSEIAEIASRYSKYELSENYPNNVERIVGLDAVQPRLEELARSLRTEFLSVMHGQPTEGLDMVRSLDECAFPPGVRILTLYPDSVYNDPGTYGYAQRLTGLGGEVRTAPTMPGLMLIFDRRTAVLPIDPASPNLGVLCTTEVAIVRAVISFFEVVWNTAVPLQLPAEGDTATGLTPLRRQILTMLGQGLTDDAVAARLAVSGRTVRRQVALIMERLDASSRFEAGLKAAQRGWILT